MMTETKENNELIKPFEKYSAGTFVDRPFLDRINPFTPFSAKKFVPNENAKKLLEKYKKEYGQNLVVLPLDEKYKKLGFENRSETTGGSFFDKDIIGGAGDPRNRYVYLNTKDPDLFSLSHEAFHAYDPNMLVNPFYNKERPTGLARIAGGFIDALTENKFDLDKQNEGNTYGKIKSLDTYSKELNANLGALKDFEFLGIKDMKGDVKKGLFSIPKNYLVFGGHYDSEEAKQIEKKAIENYLKDAKQGSIREKVENYLKNLNN